MRFAATAVVGLGLGIALAGCGGRPPVIQPIGDQVAEVGVELSIEIRASDPDGDTLSFDFDAPSLPDLKTRAQPASISAFADGVAIFRWTPTAADRAMTAYPIDFRVSDGQSTAVETVQVTVKDAGSGAGPIFRKPLGTGTTLDLDTDTCVSVDLLVDDAGATAVTLAEDDPRPDGDMLASDGPFSATWSWCPSAQQIAAQDRYMVTWSADDGANPKTRKSYLIVLRRTPKGNCPGAAPVITQTPPGAQSTVQDIPITVMITDDVGLKGTPLVYYSTTPPATPPNLSAMVQGTMARTAGSSQSGTYSGSIPNPVAMGAAGATATVYYVIVADDNDDPTGSCNHETISPVASFAVTNPGASQGLDVCAPCTSDAQCGGADDNCVVVGGMGQTFCSRACGAPLPNCPNGYHCSTAAVTSVDGTSSRQCLPTVGYCGAPPQMMTACADDNLEENDTRTAITNPTAAMLPPGTYANLVFCPASPTTGDEDWYGIPITGDATVDAKITLLTGADYSDLDLQLVDSTGAILERSYSTTSMEEVTHCVPAGGGPVYLRVFTFDTSVKQNLYDLTLTRTPGSCTAACMDDAQEPNDTPAQATALGSPIDPTVASFAGKVCSGNDDWFAQYLLDGDKLVVDLLFTQTTIKEDLDIHLYKQDATAPGGATDLTPCPPCSTSNGQGSASNEHFEWTVAAGMGGQYYVVVRGYDGSANTYTLKASITPQP
jgi:hypothetical protein